MRKEWAEPWFGRFGVQRKNLAEPWFGVWVRSSEKGTAEPWSRRLREFSLFFSFFFYHFSFFLLFFFFFFFFLFIYLFFLFIFIIFLFLIFYILFFVSFFFYLFIFIFFQTLTEFGERNWVFLRNLNLPNQSSGWSFLLTPTSQCSEFGERNGPNPGLAGSEFRGRTWRNPDSEFGFAVRRKELAEHWFGRFRVWRKNPFSIFFFYSFFSYFLFIFFLFFSFILFFYFLIFCFFILFFLFSFFFFFSSFFLLFFVVFLLYFLLFSFFFFFFFLFLYFFLFYFFIRFSYFFFRYFFFFLFFFLFFFKENPGARVQSSEKETCLSTNYEPAKPGFGPVLSPNSEPAKWRYSPVLSLNSEPWQSLEKGTGLSPNLPNQCLAPSFLRTEFGVRRKERVFLQTYQTRVIPGPVSELWTRWTRVNFV